MSQRRLLLASVAAHSALVALVLFYGGLDAHHGAVTLGMSPQDMVAAYGSGDAGSYLKAAIALAQHGRVPPDSWWVLNLWPPGMVWVDALAVAFSPFPLGATVALALSAVWGVALALLTWPLVRRRRWLLGVAVAELLVLATWPFESWMLDDGLMYADGFAAGFLLIGLAVIVHRTLNSGPLRLWFRDGLLAGAATAGSVYFRASNNLIPVALLGLAGLLILALLIRRVRHAAPSPTVQANAVLTATAAFTTILLMVPYGALIFHREHRLQFVNTQDLLYAVSWQYTDPTPLPQWLLDAGDPLGCNLDPRQCEKFIAQDPPPSAQELRDALFDAIREHPGRWISLRLDTLVRQWFTFDPNPAEGYAYLALLLAGLAASLALAWRGRWALLMVPLAAVALLGPFSFVHVEERYLIPVKLLGLLTPTLALAWSEDRKVRSSGHDRDDRASQARRTRAVRSVSATRSTSSSVRSGNNGRDSCSA
jgi:hypothetical protein